MRFSALLLCAHVVGAARTRRQDTEDKPMFQGYKVLRVVPKSEADLKMVAEEVFEDAGIEVDMWREPSSIGSPVVMMLGGGDLDKARKYLDESNIAYETTIADVQRTIDDEKSQMRTAGFSYGAFNTFEDISAHLQVLEQANPLKAKVFDMGRSLENRSTTGLRINIGNGVKPAAFIICGEHSREWIGPASCLSVIDKLLSKEGSRDMESFEWHFVPVVQPDGYVFTHTTNRMWRKNMRETGSSWGRKTVGVDINRNYGAQDATGRCINRSERSKSSDAYCGESEFSEPETRNIKNYLENLQKTRDVKLFVDVHAFSQMWLWPLGHTGNFAPDNTEMTRCGERAADAAENVAGTTWKRGPISSTIYPAGGSSVDWTYEERGIVHSYATELRDTGNYGFLAPTSAIPLSANELIASLSELATCINE